MMQTLVGRPGFRKGMDLYFERHDGQAVIIEDFAKAIADANQQTWDQFNLWYSQAGTPVVKVNESFDVRKQQYSLSLEQTCPSTPGQAEKKPFHIPLIIGLLDSNGNDLSLQHSEMTINSEGQNLLHLKESKKTFVFDSIKQKPTLSLNRQFSAPIRLDWSATDDDLLLLLSHDSDDFNRWEAGQKLATQNLLKLTSDFINKKQSPASSVLIKGFRQVFKSSLDPAMKAMIFDLPNDSYLLQLQNELIASAMEQARNTLAREIGVSLETEWREVYRQFHGKNDQGRTPKIFAERRFKNLAMHYLSLIDEGRLAFEQFKAAKIMTDQQSALSALVHQINPRREDCLQDFYQQWKTDFLVMNKWFALQAQSTANDTFEKVVKLWSHADFNLKNPNRVYALLGQFGGNLVRFHDPSKDCYTFMAERIIELDKLNPQVATRVAGCFNPWTKLIGEQKNKARLTLEKIIAAGLSKNTYEIISKALAAEEKT